MNRLTMMLVFLLAGLLCATVVGQGALQPDEEDPLLSGPKVERNEKRTLVNTDARGRLLRLEQRPEVAALGLLVLEPEHREAARQIVADRQTRLGMFLVDHIDVIREITDAMRSGKPDRAGELSRELFDQFEPVHVRAPLLEPMSEILPEEPAAELNRLVEEYWQARIDWELRNSPNAEEDAQLATGGQIAFTMFQIEMRAAYEWTLRPYHDRLQTIYEVTDATEPQRAEIRDAVIDYVRESRLQPTAEQRQDVTKRIYDVLDEQQRLRLFEQVVLRM